MEGAPGQGHALRAGRFLYLGALTLGTGFFFFFWGGGGGGGGGGGYQSILLRGPEGKTVCN